MTNIRYAAYLHPSANSDFWGQGKKGRRIFGASHWLGANWAPPGDNYTTITGQRACEACQPLGHLRDVGLGQGE